MKEACEKLGGNCIGGPSLLPHSWISTWWISNSFVGSSASSFVILFTYWKKFITYHFPLLVAYFFPKLVTHFKWIWKLNGHWDKSSMLILCSKLSTHHVSILSVFGLAFGSHPKLEKNSTLIENSLIQPYIISQHLLPSFKKSSISWQGNRLLLLPHCCVMLPE